MINKQTYLITPSLLNSWLDIYYCTDFVREAASDTISLDEKQNIAIDKAKQDFLKSLSREKSEPNQYMLQGIEYEDETYKGNTRASEYVEGGAFQIVGTKTINVGGMQFLMYGRLDVLKAGVIYDIKRVVRYQPPKYFKSCQHRFYMDLFPNAKYFEYLIDDGKSLHHEIYYRDECESIEAIIKDFIKYLERNNLIETYKKLWISKY